MEINLLTSDQLPTEEEWQALLEWVDSESSYEAASPMTAPTIAASVLFSRQMEVIQ